MSKKIYCNYGAMQQDAQRRVYETQRRVRQLVNGEINSFNTPDELSGKADIGYRKRERHPSPQYIPTDQELYDRWTRPMDDDSCKAEEHCPPESPKSQPSPPSCTSDNCEKSGSNPIFNFLGNLSDDPERALLLALLLMLISDGADLTIILVLIYLLL